MEQLNITKNELNFTWNIFIIWREVSKRIVFWRDNYTSRCDEYITHYGKYVQSHQCIFCVNIDYRVISVLKIIFWGILHNWLLNLVSMVLFISVSYTWNWLRNGVIWPLSVSSWPHIEGILRKGPYLPCVSMAGRALLAGYHGHRNDFWMMWIVLLRTPI